MAEPEERTLWQKLGWMLLIWTASVLTLAAVGSLIRLAVQPG